MPGRRRFVAATFLTVIIFLSFSRDDSYGTYSRSDQGDLAQTDERDRGIKLYEQGDMDGSVQALRGFVKKQKNDLHAWHYIESLPYGLTEQAIDVARRIKFVPASLDGKPVSQFIKVEYNFNIY